MRKAITKLNKTQESLIRQNASEKLSIPRLAERVGANYYHVYSFIIKHNLPAKIESSSLMKQRVDGQLKRSEIFNVHAKDNWLL